MKACRTCGEEKALDAFYRHPQMGDGHLNMCKECVKARVRRHRRLNESVREYDRKRSKTPKRKALSAKSLILYRASNPAANKAHSAVSHALRAGRMKKEPCLFCASTKSLHAHHRDYSKPLDVKWVCAKCHHRLHALEEAA